MPSCAPESRDRFFTPMTLSQAQLLMKKERACLKQEKSEKILFDTTLTVYYNRRHVVLRGNQMNMWCVGSYSMSWMPSIVTQDHTFSVAQLGSQQVEYYPIHHTSLVVSLCNSFNHL